MGLGLGLGLVLGLALDLSGLWAESGDAGMDDVAAIVAADGDKGTLSEGREARGGEAAGDEPGAVC